MEKLRVVGEGERNDERRQHQLHRVDGGADEGAAGDLGGGQRAHRHRRGEGGEDGEVEHEEMGDERLDPRALDERDEGQGDHQVGHGGRQPHPEQQRDHHRPTQDEQRAVGHDLGEQHPEALREVRGLEGLGQRADRDQQQRQQRDQPQAVAERLQQLRAGGAVAALEQAGEERGGDSQQPGVGRRVVAEQQVEDDAERDEERWQQPDDHGAVDRLVQGRQVRAQRLGEHADGDAGEEQQRRDEAGERDVEVGDVEEHRDDEAGEPEDRRHDLPRGGRHRLDRARHVRPEPPLLHHRDGEAAGEHDVRHRLAHDRRDNAAADDRGEGGAAPHVVARDLPDLDDELEHAHPEQDRGVDDQEVDVVGRHPGEPEHPLREPEAHVVHDEVRVVLGQHEQGDRDPVPEEEVDDGDEDQRGEQPAPVEPVQQKHPGQKDEAHVEVDCLEERVDLVQPDRVDADVERAADGRRRAEHEEPDPEPEPCREAAARLGVLPEQHLDPVDRGEDHDREHEVRVMHLRAGDEPEGREADVEGEGGSGKDEHGPRHAGELRSVHGLRAGNASGSRSAGVTACRKDDRNRA